MRNSYRSGIHGLLAIALLVWVGTARGAAENGLELYRDGHLVDALDISSLPGIIDSTPQLRGTTNAAAVAPTVSPETQLRNSLFKNASEPAAKIQQWLYTLHSRGLSPEAGDYEQLEILLRAFQAAQGDMWSAMARIGNQIEEFNLDPVILERHQQTATAIEDGAREFTAAVSAVLQGGDDALNNAIAVLDRLKFREDPQLLQNGFPYAVHKEEAPRMSREKADQALRSALGRVPAQQTTLSPVPADLAETPDIKFTQAIIDKAAELGNSPLAIYDFVHNQAGFQPYSGSRKGAANTLQQLRGNNTDQVSLLLALLRASNIPSRYVRGTVEITPADAMSWLGVNDGITAANILATAGYNPIAIFNGPDLAAIRFTHVWAVAYVPYGNYRGVPNDATGKLWVALDPSFKRSVLSPGEDVLTEMGFDVDVFIADYLSSFTEPSPIEQLELDIQAYLDTNDPGKTVADIEWRTEIAAQLLGVLPGSSQGTVLAILDEFAELADSRRYKVRFELYSGATGFIDHTLAMPDLAGKRLTIDYVGATPANQATIDSFGGIYETPPSLVDVTPRLKLDNVVIALGENGIGMGRTHSFDMQFIAPAGASNVQPLVQNDHIAGNGQAVAFDTFFDLNDPYIGSPGFPPDVLLESVLHATAVDYLSLVDRGQEKVQRLMRMLTTQDVSEAIVKNAIAVSFNSGNPVSFVWTGLVVDADRRIIGPFAVDGDVSRERPYMVLTGADGSTMENRVFENIYDQEAVSTIKILELSSDAFINLCTITNSILADCPNMAQPAAIVTAVNNALFKGNVVTIPESPITVALWSGTGYIDMDPVSGAAGYIISGGISGNVQAFSGGATVDSWTITLPCEAESVTGVVTTPPADSPDMGAVFCTNNYPITFIVDLETTCKDPPGGVWTKTVTLTTHFTTAQFGPGDYELNLIFFGSTTIRNFRIGEVQISSLNPASNLKLGEDLTVNYDVDLAPGIGLDSAKLHIHNNADTQVFKDTGIDTSPGAHTAMWPMAKWNQGAHAGAYANPKNSDYKVKIAGKYKGKSCDSNEKTINTKLIIEADIKDQLPAGGTATRVSGLDDMDTTLKVVMKKGPTETVVSGAGSITVTDNSGGSKTVIVKHIEVDNPALNTLPGGAYEVLFKDLRDEIGNFADQDNNPGNGVQPPKSDLEMW